MQQGIAQLPGAAQSMGPQGQMAPGQSAPAQVMPSQQPMTPQAYKGMLESLPPQELFAMWANPMDKTPKWAVMTAYAKAVEQARLMEQAQGQQAMAQSQSMQGTPSIAEQVMSQPMPGMGPVMAAQGDMMQGYAGGGAVAFDRGGDIDTKLLRMFPEEYERRRRAAIARGALPTPMELTPEEEAIFRVLREAPEAPPAPIPNIEVAGAPRAVPPAQRPPRQGDGQPAQQAPMQAPMQAPAQTANQIPISADIPPDVQAAHDRRIATLQGRQRPEGLLALERQMAEQAKANIEAQRAEREQFGRESRQGLEDVLARTRGAPSGMELLRVAAGIDTRKRGAGLGSLFGGVSDVMAQRQAAEEAARREYRTAQATERQMAGAIRQLEALELQRQYLQERGRFDEANKVQDQIDVLKGEMARYAVERRDKAREQQLERDKLTQQGELARAQMANALKVAGMQADRTPAEVRLMEWLRNPENKKLYESIQSSKREEDRLLKLYEIYTKNKLTLGNMSFEEFAAGLKGASAGNAGVPPPGAVRVKGQ